MPGMDEIFHKAAQSSDGKVFVSGCSLGQEMCIGFNAQFVDSLRHAIDPKRLMEVPSIFE